MKVFWNTHTGIAMPLPIIEWQYSERCDHSELLIYPLSQEPCSDKTTTITQSFSAERLMGKYQGPHHGMAALYRSTHVLREPSPWGLFVGQSAGTKWDVAGLRVDT